MKAFRNILVAVILMLAVGALAFFALRKQDGPGTGDGGVVSGSVIINEFMASNGGCLADDNGEYHDWIEIYNPTGAAVNLAGMGLSDENSGTPRWTFPNVQIEAGEYLVVFAAGTGTASAGAPAQHAAFRLSAAGGGIYLSSAAGGIADKVEYKAQTQNVSMGRVPGSGEWQAFDAQSGVGPTPGFSNDEAGRAGFEQSRRAPDTSVILTEVMSSNRATLADNTGAYSDYIEVYNKGDEAVDLKGYGLSDDPVKALKWKFPEVTLGPGEHLVVFASGQDAPAADAEKRAFHTNFRISSYRETIVLANPSGMVLDEVAVSEVPSDRAYSRVLANGAYGGDWEVSSLPTPGYPNSEEGHSLFEQSH